MKVLKSFIITLLLLLFVIGIVVALEIYPLVSSIVILLLIFLWIWTEIYEILRGKENGSNRRS